MTQARPDIRIEARQSSRTVYDWRTNPFEPHRIATYRTVAYQKTVVMKYLENLIAWGDYLFRQDSMESINEATQLYIMAAEILGPKPEEGPAPGEAAGRELQRAGAGVRRLRQRPGQVENLVPALPGNGDYGSDQPPLPMLYFCIPQNEKMLELLGHGRRPALQDPSLHEHRGRRAAARAVRAADRPGALVKAVAAGVDLSAALADLNAPLPLYRFDVLLQKANEVCNDVKSLGARCSPRWRRRTPRRSACCGRRRRSACSRR